MTRDTLLALSTGSPALSVAVFNGGQIVAQSHDIIGRGHAEALVTTIARVMDAAGLARVEAILVDIGPGSFTGVRIGVAAARALGLAWGVPVHGCTAAALVAARAFANDAALACVTVSLDAGRGQSYRQDMARDFKAGPIVITAAEAVAHHPLVAAEPDVGAALLLPLALRSLAPKPLYIRQPDAVLPL